jgi:uncharacterized protein YgfB (UPF0149 family)
VNKLPDYEAFNQLLLENHIFIEAAEMHGLLCGLLVSNPTTSAPTWVEIVAVAPDCWNKMDSKTQATFNEIREICYLQLRDPDYHFEMLIPPDEELLVERAHALGLWCKGFVKGVEYNGNYLGGLLGKPQKDVDEALQDLQAIAELDNKVGEHEEQEKAFTAVVEYVRIAVLLIQRELSVNFENIADSNTTLH